MSDIFDSNSVRGKLQEQIHIVDNLKTNLLLDSDILDFQKIHLDYKHKRLIIDSCREMSVPITVTSVKNKINRIIRALTATTISSYSSTMLSVRLRGNTQLPSDRDFMFVSYQQISNRFDFGDGILFHVIDANLSIMQVNNTLDQSINIDKNSRLDILQKYEKEDCYMAAPKYSYLAAGSGISTES